MRCSHWLTHKQLLIRRKHMQERQSINQFINQSNSWRRQHGHKASFSCLKKSSSNIIAEILQTAPSSNSISMTTRPQSIFSYPVRKLDIKHGNARSLHRLIYPIPLSKTKRTSGSEYTTVKRAHSNSNYHPSHPPRQRISNLP